MGDLDDAIDRERRQRQAQAENAQVLGGLAQVFGESILVHGFGGVAMAQTAVPTSHAEVFGDALERAKRDPSLWREEGYLFGGSMLVTARDGDHRAEKAGRKSKRAWRDYKKRNTPVFCWLIHRAGTDYNSVTVYVAGDGRTWAPSYDGGWQTAERFATAAALSFV